MKLEEALRQTTVEVTLSRKGQTRTLLLAEPALLDLIPWLRRNAAAVIEFYAGNVQIFDDLTSGRIDTIMDLVVREGVINEVCEYIELMDSKPTHQEQIPVAELMTLGQFAKVLPDVVRLSDLKGMRSNFSEMLEIAGVKMEVTPIEDEEETTPEISSKD